MQIFFHFVKSIFFLSQNPVSHCITYLNDVTITDKFVGLGAHSSIQKFDCLIVASFLCSNVIEHKFSWNKRF